MTDTSPRCARPSIALGPLAPGYGRSADAGRRGRRTTDRACAAPDDGGAGPRLREIPRRANRLPVDLTGRVAAGIRLSARGAVSAGGVAPGEVRHAGPLGRAQQLGADPARGARRTRTPGTRRRCVADGGPEVGRAG